MVVGSMPRPTGHHGHNLLPADIHIVKRFQPSHRSEMQSAVIKYHQEEFFIHDEDNAEDLLLNGLCIQSALLRDGDEIRFADVCFLFRED